MCSVRRTTTWVTPEHRARARPTAEAAAVFNNIDDVNSWRLTDEFNVSRYFRIWQWHKEIFGILIPGIEILQNLRCLVLISTLTTILASRLIEFKVSVFSWRENVLAGIIEFYFLINVEWFNMIECDKWIKVVNLKRGNKMWKLNWHA